MESCAEMADQTSEVLGTSEVWAGGLVCGLCAIKLTIWCDRCIGSSCGVDFHWPIMNGALLTGAARNRIFPSP